MRPVLDGEQLLRDMETLAQFGVDREGGGLNRIAYNSADQNARVWVETQMHAVEMLIRTDPAGNSIGLYPGTELDMLPIALGSHTDTVPNGGRFDGGFGGAGGPGLCTRFAQSQRASPPPGRSH